MNIRVIVIVCFCAEEEYSMKSVGITTAIIMSVVVPLLLIIVCVIFHIIRRRDKEAQKMRSQPVTVAYSVRRPPVQDDPAEQSMLHRTNSRETDLN